MHFNRDFQFRESHEHYKKSELLRMWTVVLLKILHYRQNSNIIICINLFENTKHTGMQLWSDKVAAYDVRYTEEATENTRLRARPLSSKNWFIPPKQLVSQHFNISSNHLQTQWEKNRAFKNKRAIPLRALNSRTK